MQQTNNMPGAVTSLYARLTRLPEIGHRIPLGYTAGLPIVAMRNDQPVVIVPFLRYKVTGEVDRTLVFPIRYVAEFMMPDRTFVGFHDLSEDPRFADIDFTKAVGLFRHDAIKDLDAKAYNELRKSVLAGYDDLVRFLATDGAVYTDAQEQKFKAELQRVIEPSLVATYYMLDKAFFEKFLKQ